MARIVTEENGRPVLLLKCDRCSQYRADTMQRPDRSVICDTCFNTTIGPLGSGRGILT